MRPFPTLASIDVHVSYDPKATLPSKHIKSGPLLARQGNDILIAFRWLADSGPRLYAGWATCLRFGHFTRVVMVN